jgi:hypothetical protein
MFPRQQIGACEVIIFTGAFAASASLNKNFVILQKGQKYLRCFAAAFC